MRVAIVTANFPNTSETFISDHVLGLRALGHEVHVLARRPVPSSKAGDQDLVDVSDVDVTYLDDPPGGWLSRKGAFLAAETSLARSRPRLAFRVAREHSPSGASRWELLEMINGLRRLGKKDLYHCHYGPIGARVVDALALTGSDTPVVTTFHGFDLTRQLRELGDGQYDRLFQLGSRFLPVSAYFKDRLIDLGAPADRTVVHRVGIDTNALRPKNVTRASGSTLSVLMIGRMVEKKGFRYGLEAVGQAARAGVDLSLRVVGGGPLMGEMEESVQGLGLQHVATLLGPQPRAAVRAELGRADVLVAPSVTAADGDMEGIPVAIMEAMAMGVPVVSTNHSGIPELVIDGTTGLLVAERDSDGLTAALAKLARDTDLRERLATQGRAFVVEHHDLTSNLGRLERLYGELLR